MVSKADEYRTEAVGCALKARLAHGRRAKASFKEMARHWLEMAERAERPGGAERRGGQETTSKPSPAPAAGAGEA